MSFKKRFLTAAALVCAAAAILLIGYSGRAISEEREDTFFTRRKENLYFWYTDEALTDYLTSAAVAYGESRDDVRVIPVLTSGLEYLESINKASVQSEAPPDLYIISNDSLEKAFLAGLASRVPEEEWDKIKEGYPDAARLAVTYKNKVIGYPFYFETSALLYNRTYLEEFAAKQIEAEQDAIAAEEAMAQLEAYGPEGADIAGGDGGQGMADGSSAENGQQETGSGAGESDGQQAPEGGTGESDGQQAPEGGAGSADGQQMPEGDTGDPDGQQAEEADRLQQEIAERVKTMLPDTIDDILEFANEYDAPEQVEAVFKWDVTDIFYNYFFAGNYLDVGGSAGDDIQNMNIYNKDAIACLKVYQDLNQFFSIDTQEISYEGVLEDFMEGKLVFTVATTDSVAKLENAKADGTFAYDYSIAKVPDINERLLTRSLSVTNCVVVNGYSEKQELASDFAEFLTCDYTDTLYSRTGKVASRHGVDYGNDNLQQFVNEYEVSIPMPKMVETSNFWIELEIAFAQIWDGADANMRLKELSEQIMTQVTGAPYTEEVIEDEVQEEEEVEYLDEDALREEAQGEVDNP